MKISVLLFAGLREQAQRQRIELDLPQGSTARDLLEILGQQIPDLKLSLTNCRVAVDCDFVHFDEAINLSAHEIAVIPPVSGGHDHFYVGEKPLVLADLIEAVAHSEAGGIATFIGIVRRHSRGHIIHHLEYEAYVPMAVKTISRIADEICREILGTRLAIHHRLGSLRIGEAAVMIAASAAHRQEAFQACRTAIDRLKQDVPIWKREISEDGSSWYGPGA